MEARKRVSGWDNFPVNLAFEAGDTRSYVLLAETAIQSA
jgi:hypothetical protein